MKELRILITGGTLDKVHDPYTEGLAFAKDGSTQVPEVLNFGRCHFPHIEQILMLDSLNMDDAARAKLANAMLQASEEAIVITHGTSTMGQTARFLAEQGAAKTVVLTGAMRPFSLNFSDAGFNLGGAIIAAQTMPHGVYGVMNGRIFTADALNKNTEQGRFDI